MHTPAPIAPRTHRTSVGWYISGGVVAAIGFIILQYDSRGYGICQSSFGVLAQGFNQQTRANCNELSTEHALSMLAIAGGLAAIVIGLIRQLTYAQRAQARQETGQPGSGGA
jgi:hypothetical protein